jgi:hypothetical protein
MTQQQNMPRQILWQPSDKDTKGKVSTYDPAANARSAALVRQAVYAYPGMTYAQIREWVRKARGVIIENVGARVREMDGRNPNFKQYVTTTQDEKGNIHVYPFLEETTSITIESEEQET